MTRKIWDILPPEEPSSSLKMEKPLVEEKEELPKKIKINWVWFLIPLSLIIAVIVGFQLSKVEIKIWPETKTDFSKTNLTIDTEVEKPDFENKTIPGQFLKIEESISDSFLSSGRTLKKAEGIIRLYNAYSTKSENWLAETRFVSSEGKLYKSKDKIAVPGAEIENGKIIPKYVDVPVIAAEAGENYNIGHSHFSIFVFRGTPRYTKFYGESFEEIKGGGDSPQITTEDIENAKESVSKKAKTKAVTSLENKVTDEFVFLDDILETEIKDIFSLAKEGDEVERFNSGATVEATTIIFKKEEVQNFVKEFIFSETHEEKLLYEESLKIDYTPQIVDFESGKVVLSLSFSIKMYPDINLQLLKESLVGKSLIETKIFLEKQSEFINIEIRFWPFWVKSVPEDLNKIEIKYPIID
ncbi:MAG: hypothetical protein ACKKMO_00315 [Candidatus Nealsonbacteria bacterium]